MLATNICGTKAMETAYYSNKDILIIFSKMILACGMSTNTTAAATAGGIIKSHPHKPRDSNHRGKDISNMSTMATESANLPVTSDSAPLGYRCQRHS